MKLLRWKKKNRRAMLECIDRFHAEIETQSKGLKEIAALFKVVEPKSLIYASDEELQAHAKTLTEFHDEVLKVNSWLKYHDYEGILLLLRLMQMMPIIGPLCNFLEFIIGWDFIESLPNIFLSLETVFNHMCFCCFMRKKFSKLKLIENYLRIYNGTV